MKMQHTFTHVQTIKKKRKHFYKLVILNAFNFNLVEKIQNFGNRKTPQNATVICFFTGC